MKRELRIESRLRYATLGMALGHQFGQWSERRWWHFTQEDKRGTELLFHLGK